MRVRGRFRWLASVAFFAVVGEAAAQPIKSPAGETPRQLPPTWPSLQRFSGDAEFLQYVRVVRGLREAQDRRRYSHYEADSIAGAAPPPPAPAQAPSQQAQANVSTPTGASVTNVQTQGVDEGDIVKQLGRFLIVLQDGRLFVVDTAPGGRPGLALASRANVYRDAHNQMWYDEMLVAGNRILVTGYSYREAASEITIFTINDAGQLHREAIYYLSSNDYYSAENYATRLVNGNLVIYTPLNIAYLNPDQPMRWPLIRRWLRDGARQAETTRGKPLFDAHDIFKPIRPTLAPFVHSVSVCPLGDLRSGDELDCRTTAFVGAAGREFFVSTSDIYLWVTPGWGDSECEDNSHNRAVSATLYQVPLSGRPPRALFARGAPINQFALDANGGEFRALLGSDGCGGYNEHPRVRYFHVPLGALAASPATAPDWNYVNEPSPDGAGYEPRFTEAYLVYGSRPSFSSYPPQGQTVTGRVVAVPLARPNNPVTIEAPHGVLRVERAGGENIALTGYRTDEGLSVSLLDLRQRPRIADTRLLAGRFESENRSHAFNSLIGPDGGLMGLPTVGGVKQSGRWVFRSQASDVSFLSVDGAGRLGDMGLLNANDRAQDPSYRCEVSCIDWYGNTRAIFTGGRIFALSGTEMIEGGVSGAGIGERRRLNLSQPPPES